MGVNRRNFMRSVGAACAATSFGGWSAGTLAALGQPDITGAMRPVGSLCEMCSFRCPITAQVVDKKTVFIHGNTNAPQQAGRICARGGSGVSLLYDPNRIVQPMKRTGPRGSGQWKVISWEMAYKEIARKLNVIKQKYGAESVMFSSKSGSLAPHLFQLAKVFGSPNTFTHATTCPAGRYVAASIMMGGDLKADVINTKYLLTFGHNLYEGIEVADTYQHMEAQERGAKFVSFDPRLSVVSSKADEWHPVRPGGDLPVVLAMCHTLIKEDLYDHDFIKRYTSGFEAFAETVKNCTPEWAQEHSDISADVIRRITREIAAAAPHVIVSPGHRTTYTPEEIDLRRTLFAMNALLGNIERKGGMYQAKSSAIYNKLAGETVAPELKGISVNGVPAITAKRIDEVDPQFKYVVKSGGIVQQIIEAVETEQPYQVKAWIMARHNVVQTVTDRAALVKTLEKLDLIVNCDVYMTESAAYADYLLPDTTYLERDEDISDVSLMNPAYAVRQPAVDVIGNAKPSWLIWKELGSALGLAAYYPWKDMQQRQLQQLGGDKVLHKKLSEAGYLDYGKAPLLYREPEMVAKFIKTYPSAVSPDQDGTYGSHLKFKSPSGLIELESPSLEAVAPGYATPKFRNVPMKKDDELFFVQGKVAVHTNGATQYVPLLAELMKSNSVWIHPETAKLHGIKTGDEVWLSNSTGKEKGRALVTVGTRPDTVYVYMGGGAKAGARTQGTHDGIHCGNLLPHKISPVVGTCLNTTGVKLERA